MLAIIETGGKQYLVTPQQTLKIEKIKGIQEGDTILFDKVLLLVDDDKNIQIGQPYLKGVKIEAEAKEIGKSKKVIVFRYHNKTRYKKKKGHRQSYAKVKISKTSLENSKKETTKKSTK